uniref:Uncharacterized protein n=1 Tax=Oryza brachyantha TaxID=4533 RepID=J3MDA6_ORYBR
RRLPPPPPPPTPPQGRKDRRSQARKVDNLCCSIPFCFRCMRFESNRCGWGSKSSRRTPVRSGDLKCIGGRRGGEKPG